MATRPTLLNCAIAAYGDRTNIQNYPADAGTGRISVREGWGSVNSLPIADGGVPPYREDMNGAFWLLSQLLVYMEHGGWFAYNASSDYLKGAEVFDSQWQVKYRALQDNGPNHGGAKALTNTAYWKKLDRAGVPPGTIACFANVTLGTGTYAKNPKFWGESDPDPTWVLADGTSYTINGTTFSTPDLRNRFIYGGTVAQQGTTGGNSSVTSGSTTVSGTIDATTLNQNQIPSHTHTLTMNAIAAHTHNISSSGPHTHDATYFSSTGAHTHQRGTMNITGYFGADDRAVHTNDGKVFKEGTYGYSTGSTGSETGWIMDFDASGNWTGATSSNGDHTHAISSSGAHTHSTQSAGGVTPSGSLSSVGGGQSHTHGFSSTGHTHTVSTLPPFYRMAYFVKLPEA